jgi:Zn-dependent protease
MFRLGRLLGHELYVSWTALLLVFFYMEFLLRKGEAGYGALLAGGAFLSILLHELGHAVVATRLGYGPCRIVLHGFGGVAVHRRAPDQESIRISLAGPAAGIFFGVLLWGLSEYVLRDLSDDGKGVMQQLLFINLVWSVVNLLPIYPLDGGHVSEILLRGSLGRENGRKAAAVLSLLVLGGALFYAYRAGWSLRSPLMIFLVINLALQNLNLFRGEEGNGLGGY